MNAPVELSATDALRARLTSLLLTGNGPATVAGVVEWLGAMQAQDAGSAAWSLGARLPGLTTQDIDTAIEAREALRTWPMRGTVHYVPPRDAHWMLDLMGSRALAGAAKRRATLGLADEVAERAVEIFATVLAGGKRLTRAQCLDALRAEGIVVDGNLGYHLLWYASQRGVTCFAPAIGTEQAFTLLDEWVGEPRRLTRDEALATIALRYFRGHGPASVADLAGWTGLPVTACRAGIADAGLTRVRVDGAELLTTAESLDGPATPAALALPGFDEYMLGYKDRSMMLDRADFDRVVPGGNGVFRPTIVLRGRVAGTWKRTPRRTRAEVVVTPFSPLSAADRRAAAAAFEPYGHFLGLPVEVRLDLTL